jgi:N-acetylmuramoyl-L-alanine amidase
VRRVFFFVVVLAVAHLAALRTSYYGQGSAPLPTTPVVPSPRQEPPSAPAPTGNAASPQSQARIPLAVVVLDPAHGGADAGARGAAAGVVESDIVLDFARAIRVALEGQGLRILLTREGNEGPSMDSRSAMVNALRGAVFITLHVSSTGPVGTARVYWYAFPDVSPSFTNSGTRTPLSTAPVTAPPTQPRGLVEWNQAQQPFLESSQRLAELLQAQLAQKFSGSPATPEPVAVRQLRTIAAPAVAIEISSVAVPNAQQLLQTGGALAEAVARGVTDFREEGH